MASEIANLNGLSQIGTPVRIRGSTKMPTRATAAGTPMIPVKIISGRCQRAAPRSVVVMPGMLVAGTRPGVRPQAPTAAPGSEPFSYLGRTRNIDLVDEVVFPRTP